MKFSDLNLISPLQKALDKQGFETPTEIQEKAIPYALEWSDILWTAQTGSWKTLAFTLPILQRMYQKRYEARTAEWQQKRIIKTLILAPTRELAIQIWDTFAPLCVNTNFKYTVINGWVNQFHQVKALEKWVDILIATPWRLLDLISQGFINISKVEQFVIDEADKMLEMGFMVDVKKIIKWVKDNKQTYFFSATMPREVREMAGEILENPFHIKVNEDTLATETIEQKVYSINQWNKRQLLQQIVKRDDLESIIVFTNTKDQTDILIEYLEAIDIKCDVIHRNKTQNGRQKALTSLKTWEIKVMVATDIASRGLDVSNLSCVVNRDIPGEPETYVHRIWRTGRAWKEGLSISFMTAEDKEKIRAIERLLWNKIPIETDTSYKSEVIPKSKYKMTNAEFKKEKKAQRKAYVPSYLTKWKEETRWGSKSKSKSWRHRDDYQKRWKSKEEIEKIDNSRDSFKKENDRPERKSTKKSSTYKWPRWKQGENKWNSVWRFWTKKRYK